MSIKFYSHDPDITEELVIGGKDDSFAANEVGGYGPFPSYSISREDIFANDGSYLNSKYSINITGYATIKPNDATSILTKGGRQAKIIGEQIIKLQTNRSEWPMSGAGTLDIELYDGTAGILRFYDARLLNVEIPESSEESSGVHYTEYSFTFEAYNFDDHSIPTDSVSSVGESWDFNLNEGQYSYENDDISTTAYKTYTLSRTLSATGIKRYIGGVLNKDSWKNAADWVEKRILNQVSFDTELEKHTNMVDNENRPKFKPMKMNTELGDENLIPNLIDNQKYKTFNHSRTCNTDIANASYSVTDTWILALEKSTCLQTVQTNVDFNQNSNAPTIEVSGEITGLNTYSITSQKNNAYENAKDIVNKNIGKSFGLAETAYNGSNVSPYLVPSTYKVQNNKQQTSVAHNRNTGTITWSVRYIADKFLCDEELIQSENITETYDNPYLENRHVAIIPVIGLAEGPIFQTFMKIGNGTINKEKKININIDIVLKPDKRKIQDARKAVKNYLSGKRGQFVSAISESFNEDTGSYNVNIEWIG